MPGRARAPALLAAALLAALPATAFAAAPASAASASPARAPVASVPASASGASAPPAPAPSRASVARGAMPSTPAGAAPAPDVLEAPLALPAPRVPVQGVPVPDPGVVLVATPATVGVARALAPRLAEERRDLAAVLGADLVAPLQIRLGHGRAEFAGLLPGGTAPVWASGLAYPGLGLVIVDVQASARGGDVGQVLRHEIAHVALARAGGGRLPRWFSEGFAILHSGEWSFSRSVVLARAAGADALLPIGDLERGWPSSPTDVNLAYAQSVSLVTFLLRVEDGAALRRMFVELAAGQPFDTAFRAAFGQPLAGAEIDWKRSLQSRWGWLPVAFDPNLAWALAAVLLALGALRIRFHRRRRLAGLPDDPADDALDGAPATHGNDSAADSSDAPGDVPGSGTGPYPAPEHATDPAEDAADTTVGDDLPPPADRRRLDS